MRRLILIMFCIPAILSAQYYGERVTDQSFETSSLFFNSHFLNTFGIYQFKDAAVGLIDDPFLNVYLNPANVPETDNKELYLYLDFRGDRTEVDVVENYIYPTYLSSDLSRSFYPPIDRRWFTRTRREPEPVVSVGFINFPLSDNRNLYFGGSYQLVYSEEKFYQVPYGIYSPLFAYDSFNSRADAEFGGIPIEDRYSGKDEMLVETHFLSGFAGYKISETLSAGVFVNGVIHARDGEYGNSNNDEYGNTDNSEWQNSDFTSRNQDYDHIDFSAGLSYSPNNNFSLGLKAGILTGETKQNFGSASSYYYKYNEPNVTEDWSYNFTDYSSRQNLVHDGNTKYIGLNLNRKFKNGSGLVSYYRYSFSDIDVSGSSQIRDTSYYTSRWVWSNEFNRYEGISSLFDLRTNTGTRKNYRHEGLLALNWTLNEKTKVTIGLYVKNDKYVVKNEEPAVVRRHSESESEHSNPTYNRTYSHSLDEDKTLHWNYKSKTFTFQIPIMVNFKINDYWGFMLGVNRVLNTWKITDQTTAVFDRRKQIKNGVEKEENNFGERYTQPDERISENFFDVFAGLNLDLTDKFKVQLLVDPESEPIIRIAQWWLSFRAGI